MNRATRLALLVAGLVGLGGCTTLGPGGYAGADWGPGYYDGYGYGPDFYRGPVFAGAGWFGDWYWPGRGGFLYDRRGFRRGWTPREQAFFRERRLDRREYRVDRAQDRRAYRIERRQNRQALRQGQISRPAYRAEQRQDRRAYRLERWRDKADYRADRRQDRRDFRRYGRVRRD